MGRKLSNGYKLIDPTAGKPVLWIRCKECGNRPVGVVQEGGRVPTAHDGEVLTGYLRTTLSGKANIQGNRATTTSKGLLDPDRTPRLVVCPRHGNLFLDQRVAHAMITHNTGSKPASLSICREQESDIAF